MRIYIDRFLISVFILCVWVEFYGFTCRLLNKSAQTLCLILVGAVYSLLVAIGHLQIKPKPCPVYLLKVTVDQNESCCRCILLADCCGRAGVRVSKRRSCNSLPKNFPGRAHKPFQHRLPDQPFQALPECICVSHWYCRLLLLPWSNIPV